jgi:hypothetical protein
MMSKRLLAQSNGTQAPTKYAVKVSGRKGKLLVVKSVSFKVRRVSFKVRGF